MLRTADTAQLFCRLVDHVLGPGNIGGLTQIGVSLSGYQTLCLNMPPEHETGGEQRGIVC